MSQNSTADTAMIYKLAQLFLCVSKYETTKVVKDLPGVVPSDVALQGHTEDPSCGSRSEIFSEASVDLMDLGSYSRLQDESHTNENDHVTMINDMSDHFGNYFASDGCLITDPVSQFMRAVPSSKIRSAGDPPELFLPGLVIHLIRQHRGIGFPVWKGLGFQAREPPYRAIIAD